MIKSPLNVVVPDVPNEYNTHYVDEFPEGTKFVCVKNDVYYIERGILKRTGWTKKFAQMPVFERMND